MEYKSKIKNKNKQGSALAYVLVVMTIVSMILVSMLQYISSQIRYGFYNYYKEESFQIAESGINFYKWYLAKEMETITTPQEVQDFWANGDPIGVEHDCSESDAYIVDYAVGGVDGKYCIEVDPPEEWSTIFTVRAIGWTNKEPEIKRTVQARFRRPSFSEYMLIGDEQFVLNDEAVTHGRVHSNTGIHFNGVAYNVVSSEQELYEFSGGLWGIGADEDKPGVWTYWSNEYNNTQHKNVFQAGKQIGTNDGAVHWDFPSINPYISFAREKALSGTSPPGTPCDSDGCYFGNTGEGRHIIFNGNTMTVCTVNSYCTSPLAQWSCWNGLIFNRYSILNYKKNSGSGTCSSCTAGNSCASTYTIPNNGAIYVEDNAWVEGTLGTSSNHKKLTVVAADTLITGAEKNIFIGRNNLVYSSYEGEDVLGLLAQNNVEIIRQSQNNLIINAALMAKDGRVGRESYVFDWPNSITFLGSIVSKGMFNVGKGVLWSWDVGYQNAYLNFDNNLLYYPPPFFPTGVGYTMDGWEEL